MITAEEPKVYSLFACVSEDWHQKVAEIAGELNVTTNERIIRAGETPSFSTASVSAYLRRRHPSRFDKRVWSGMGGRSMAVAFVHQFLALQAVPELFLA